MKKTILAVTAVLIFSIGVFAQNGAKATDTPKPANPSSVVPIPVPKEESAQLGVLQAEAARLQADYVQKMQTLQSRWDLIVTRAALRARLAPEQLDALVAEADGKGGFNFVPRKVEPPKADPK